MTINDSFSVDQHLLLLIFNLVLGDLMEENLWIVSDSLSTDFLARIEETNIKIFIEPQQNRLSENILTSFLKGPWLRLYLCLDGLQPLE